MPSYQNKDMDEKNVIVELLNQVVAQNTPLDAHAVLQEIIEKAQSLQDECLIMEYALNNE